MEIDSWPAAAGQVFCRLIHGLHVILPAEGETEFQLTGSPIDQPERIEIASTPFECVLQGVNRDPTFDHAFTVRITLVPSATEPLSTDGEAQRMLAADWLMGK